MGFAMHDARCWWPILAVVTSVFGGDLTRAWGKEGLPAELVFCIGRPDGSAGEFGLVNEGYKAFSTKYAQPVVYTVGQSAASEWPFVHPAQRDGWAGGRRHVYTIQYNAPQAEAGPLYLLIGVADGHPSERSKVTVTVNGKPLPKQTAPKSGRGNLIFAPRTPGTPATLRFTLPAGAIVQGPNTLTIALDEQSWIIYDYVALSRRPEALDPTAFHRAELLAGFLAGPMAGVKAVVFAVRTLAPDGHWYANFSHYADSEERTTYGKGGRLCRLDLPQRALVTLLDDPEGAVRDPNVHYDGQTIVFSYRKGGQEHYHLYQIQADGSGLKQLTDGPFDDLEPTFLPDGDLVFVSSRCNRWVNCWLTRVAVLHRCHADGSGIRALSSNNEHDNTPWVLPSGQILYTRWEYVDRSQVSFHHLWMTSPDGMRQTVFFGNLKPGTTMIDAKPVPDSPLVVASFSPGHGRREHDGVVTLLDPRSGPDGEQAATRSISHTADFRDPWAFSPDAFLAARRAEILLLDGEGRSDALFRLSEEDRASGRECHEPRPLMTRPREVVVSDATQPQRETGKILVLDVHQGRNMAGVKPGEIKKLLVLETLPKPINFTGGMEPLSYGGTFTLERILGTLPVEPDGSVYAELPALRSVFFVALDEHDISVKRMQSFMTVMPGETTTCIGCHEMRTQAPSFRPGDFTAFRRSPSKITPLEGLPDVLDFPRDVQPVLDANCVRCHNCDEPGGGVNLSGDRGPMFSLSYFNITARSLVADGRNGVGNRPPRAIGSGGSRLLGFLDGSHYDARPTDRERTIVRLWIDTGAAYPGTYAALGSGMIGGYAQNKLDRSDLEWPAVQAAVAAIDKRCAQCHQGERLLPRSPSDEIAAPPWVTLGDNDVRRRFARHLLYNLTRPEKSPLLLAPLAKSAGGREACGQPIFADTQDADYQQILASITAAQQRLNEIKRFDMPGFRPRPEYLREMVRYGVLPADLNADTPVDPYRAERAYWESLWYRAAALK